MTQLRLRGGSVVVTAIIAMNALASADKGTRETAKDAERRPKMRPQLALRAARPWSFTATLGPVALGAALASKLEGAFSVPLFALSLVSTVGVHAAGNLMNTYFDFTKGVDTPGSSDLTLVKRELLPDQVATLIGGWYGLAAAAAVPLCSLSRAPLAQLAALLVAGGASAFVYTGGPGLKYKALGDILISSTFGPLLVGFSYLVQTGSLGWTPLLASLPITMHIEAILHANNARDIKDDLAQGVRTLASRLGPDKSLGFYTTLIGAPFGVALYAALRHSLVALLPLLALPKAIDLVRAFRRHELARLPMRTAKLQFLFGSLLVASVLLPSSRVPSLVGLGRGLLGFGRPGA